MADACIITDPAVLPGLLMVADIDMCLHSQRSIDDGLWYRDKSLVAVC